MNFEKELIMIHETLWLIPTYITINRGLNSWGRLALVVVIHETSVNVKLTPNIGVILHQNHFPHSLIRFYRESGSGALWLLCADEV